MFQVPSLYPEVECEGVGVVLDLSEDSSHEEVRAEVGGEEFQVLGGEERSQVVAVTQGVHIPVNKHITCKKNKK